MTQDRFTGVGLELRRPHLELVARMADIAVPFWETCPENVVGDGGRQHRLTCASLDRDPVLTQGLTISVGGFDDWEEDYLRDLGEFLIRTETPWHSGHLCFTSVDANCLHELLPLPFTRKAVRHTITRTKDLQFRLPVPLLLENITYCAELGAAEMDERRTSSQPCSRALTWVGCWR